MRLYFILIVTAISMAFVTGYVALFIQGTYTATDEDVAEINQIKQAFQKYVSPRSIVNFNSLFFSQNQYRLLDPVYTIPEQSSDKDYLRFIGKENCYADVANLFNQGTFEKVLLWEEFRCGRRKVLPQGFFLEAPFIHPSGKSYAYLAFRLAKNGHDSDVWIQNHLPYFHSVELTEVKKAIGPLRGVFEFLEKLDEGDLVDIVRGKGTILSKHYLFARLTYPKIFSILEYRIYDRKYLDKFLSDSPYVLRPYERGKPCFYKDGSLCWTYNLKHIFRLANTSTVGLFLGLIIIIGLVVRLLLTKIKNQRLDDEKRRLALRVLTHEFRTPITSMLLLMERFSKNFDFLNEDLQEAYLRMSSEVHRLKRLTETSRNYLKAEQNKKLLDLNEEWIPSLNSFVEESLMPFRDIHEDQIKFTPLTVDRKARVDAYWLGICLKNIIDNAITHGKFPIDISLIEKGSKMEIAVRDSGQIEFEKLETMLDEFVKGNKSQGTGLGMNIVKKVIKEMGGEISLKRDPTIISLVLSNKRILND